MKTIFYKVRNASGTDGQYYLNGRYYFIAAGQTITLSRKPSNTTANVVVSMFKKEVFDTEPHKIPIEEENSRKGGAKTTETTVVLERNKLLTTKEITEEDIEEDEPIEKKEDKPIEKKDDNSGDKKQETKG